MSTGQRPAFAAVVSMTVERVRQPDECRHGWAKWGIPPCESCARSRRDSDRWVEALRRPTS